MMSAALLEYVERSAATAPDGLLVLHHGRGTDERDLLGLADVLDPHARLHAVSARGPLQLPGSPGYHWYRVLRVGHPDPGTFFAARAELAALHDHLLDRLGLEPDRLVLGGFSMGCVMSYALGLDRGRPAPAGILALSGFIPTVEGWTPALDEPARAARTKVFVSHGVHDPVIEVGFARRARGLLATGGFEVEYRETPAAHHLEPEGMRAAAAWAQALLPRGGALSSE